MFSSVIYCIVYVFMHNVYTTHMYFIEHFKKTGKIQNKPNQDFCTACT